MPADTTAYIKGQYAFADGQSIRCNPYDIDEDFDRYDAWEDGWMDASEVEVIPG